MRYYENEANRREQLGVRVNEAKSSCAKPKVETNCGLEHGGVVAGSRKSKRLEMKWAMTFMTFIHDYL